MTDLSHLPKWKRWRIRFAQKYGIAWSTLWSRKNEGTQHPKARCEMCNEEFQPTRLHHRYCSPKCRVADYRLRKKGLL